MNALSEFGITLPKDIAVRLAAVSDGYPYYVHLITEKMLWLLFEKSELINSVTWDDYFEALNSAIEGITAELARPYEQAMGQRGSEYEHVLWSTAADEWQGARLADMYAQYENIVDQVPNATKLDYSKFSTRLRNLLKPDYGEILVRGHRQGFYMYREKMLSGYIRMQAEANHIELINKEARATIKNYIRVPAKNVGYKKSQPPRGY